MKRYTKYERNWMVAKAVKESISLIIIIIGIVILVKSFMIDEAIYHGGPLFVGGMTLIIVGACFMAEAINYKFKDSLYGKRQRTSLKYSKRTRR